MLRDLNRNLNSHYFDLFETGVAIVKKVIHLKYRISKINIPKYVFYHPKRYKIILKAVANRKQKVLIEYTDWLENAMEFIKNPQYFYPQNSNYNNLDYIHLTNLIIDYRGNIESHIDILDQNIKDLNNTIGTKINYNIAISAWIITSLGFIISVISLSR